MMSIPPATPRRLGLIGTYAEASQPGVYVIEYEEASGKLHIRSTVDGLRNPTFLDVDAETSCVYTLMEEKTEEGNRYGAAAAFKLNSADGTLELLNKTATLPAPTCHIALDRTRRFVVTASYHGGLVGLSPVLPDGRIGEPLDVKQHTGKSLLPVQSQGRCHSATFDRGNRFVLVCDLGLDKVISYELDAAAGQLVYKSEVKLTPGSGPRHFAFHPYLPFAYVINELGSTVTAFAYDEETGTLTEKQTISTLPGYFVLENACADIHISPDGRFLYGSNRGHDSLAIFAIDPTTGTLTVVDYASTRGAHPRNFALSPDAEARFVFVANRDTDQVVVFYRAGDTGMLTPAGYALDIPKPVCVRFLPDGAE